MGEARTVIKTLVVLLAVITSHDALGLFTYSSAHFYE